MTNEFINKTLGIEESYQMPERLMKIDYRRKKRKGNEQQVKPVHHNSIERKLYDSTSNY